MTYNVFSGTLNPTQSINHLELRLLHLDLVYVYKILFGMVETEVSTHFVRHKLDTGTRDHSLKLFAHHSRIDVRTHFFLQWYRTMLE